VLVLMLMLPRSASAPRFSSSASAVSRHPSRRSFSPPPSWLLLLLSRAALLAAIAAAAAAAACCCCCCRCCGRRRLRRSPIPWSSSVGGVATATARPASASACRLSQAMPASSRRACPSCPPRRANGRCVRASGRALVYMHSCLLARMCVCVCVFVCVAALLWSNDCRDDGGLSDGVDYAEDASTFAPLTHRPPSTSLPRAILAHAHLRTC
jgi:hypothetical protein